MINRNQLAEIDEEIDSEIAAIQLEDISVEKHNRKESTGHLITQAAIDAVKKLNPRNMVHNPVMFVVEVGSVISTY